jgi:hypothetical protein
MSKILKPYQLKLFSHAEQSENVWKGSMPEFARGRGRKANRKKLVLKH